MFPCGENKVAQEGGATVRERQDLLSVDDVLLESRSSSLLVVGDNEIDISGFAPGSVHSESVLSRTEKLGLLLSVDSSRVQNEKNLRKIVDAGNQRPLFPRTPGATHFDHCDRVESGRVEKEKRLVGEKE